MWFLERVFIIDLLRLLARLLSTSTDFTVLAIACHDLGQYVKYSSDPNSKRFEHYQKIIVKNKKFLFLIAIYNLLVPNNESWNSWRIKMQV